MNRVLVDLGSKIQNQTYKNKNILTFFSTNLNFYGYIKVSVMISLLIRVLLAFQSEFQTLPVPKYSGIRRHFCVFTRHSLFKFPKPLLNFKMTHSVSTSSASRLAQSTSPYLRQHAGNPVDWYPWGEEALKAARDQKKPIFLSIGYSTCHWCHVMAHESFERVSARVGNMFINLLF